jgi:Chaperone of endosialidase
MKSLRNRPGKTTPGTHAASRTLCLLLLALAHAPFDTVAQGTAFTYQGRLSDGANPTSGTYDLRFWIFDSATGGTLVAGPVTNATTAVSNGLFTIVVDFGAGVFTGAGRWLEISVRTNGSAGAYSTLAPRQALTAAPYALLAGDVNSSVVARLNVPNTTVQATGHPTVTSGFITSAKVDNSGSGYTTAPSVIVNANGPGGGAVITATVSGGSVTALTVNNAGSGYTGSPTLTIGTPPSNAYQVFTGTNFFTGANTFTGPGSSFAGSFTGNGAGLTNLNSWLLSGNAGTTAGVNFLGTTDNQPLELKANGLRALRLEPGYYTTPHTIYSNAPNVIEGCSANSVDSGMVGSVISGGGSIFFLTNFVNGYTIYTFSNRIGSSLAFIGGGDANFIGTNSFGSTIVGGGGNAVGTNAQYSAICGGGNNIIQNAAYSSLGGGSNNIIAASFGTVSGGQDNTIQPGGLTSTIGGGEFNTVNDFDSTIAGGNGNTVQAGASSSTIGGGLQNIISAYESVIGGGNDNQITVGAYVATISGGVHNRVGGAGATVPGGNSNQAGGINSFAAGTAALATNNGAFVWADATSYSGFSSTTDNQFNVRAAGGARLFSNATATLGAQLAPNATSWTSLSDRSAKENIQPIDAMGVLERLAQLPITQWSYKEDPTHRRYIGPMAQDFHHAFELGDDDKRINTLDTDGVTLAAIQGLNQKVEEQRTALNQKETEITELKREMAEIKAQLAHVSARVTRQKSTRSNE